MLSQKLDRSRGILNCFHFIEALIKREGSLPFRFRSVGQLNAGFLSPKQVGANRNEAVRRIPIADSAHIFVDAEDFLQHDDARTVATRGQSHVSVEFSAIERFQRSHSRLVL